MCFHGSFASQMGCSTARDTPGQSLRLLPLPLVVHVAHRLQPLEPFDLISSVRLNGDRFGRRDDETDRRAERIVLFSTKPGLRVQFLPLPKAGHVDVDDNHPQVAADIFRGEKEGMDTDTKRPRTTKHPIDLTNTAKRRNARSYKP